MPAPSFMMAGAYRPGDDHVVLVADSVITAIPALRAKAMADAIYAALNARDVGRAIMAEAKA